MDQTNNAGHQKLKIDLRTGSPYAQLIRSHGEFAALVGKYFNVPPCNVIPSSGATGGIEAVRNHIFRVVPRRSPVLLTVSPGYWRARECFQGFGFELVDLETEAAGFAISEAALIQKAKEIKPDLIYLSLPNNPTGATFDATTILQGIGESVSVLLDLTLPNGKVDARKLTGELYQRFHGRERGFLVGSTSKSHNTAQYRIGWVVCTDSRDAATLKQENRNVVSSVSVEEASGQLKKEPSVHALIEKSFCMLKAAQQEGGFRLIQPPSRVESSYALISFLHDTRTLRESLEQHGICVMWGSEFGLNDNYVRVEMSEPDSLSAFIRILTCSSRPIPLFAASPTTS